MGDREVDQQLVERAQRGDKRAFELLVVKYQRRIERLIGRMPLRRRRSAIQIGVRLLQRSTRKFAVTDVGNSVYRHAQTMLAEANAAREVVDRLSAASSCVWSDRAYGVQMIRRSDVPGLMDDYAQVWHW